MQTELSRRKFLQMAGTSALALALPHQALTNEIFIPLVEGPESPQEIINDMFGREVAFEVLPEVENLENAKEILSMIPETYNVMRDALRTSNANPHDVLLPDLKSIRVSVDPTLPERGFAGQTITSVNGELQLILLSPGIHPEDVAHEIGHTMFRSDIYSNEKYTHNADVLEETQAMIFSYQSTLNAVLKGNLEVSYITRLTNQFFNRWHVQMAPDMDKRAFNKILEDLLHDKATQKNPLVFYLPYTFASEFAFRSTVDLNGTADKGKGPAAFVAFKGLLVNPNYRAPQSIGNLFFDIHDEMVKEGHIADGSYNLENHVLYTGAVAVGWDNNFIAKDEVTGEYINGQRINGLAFYLDGDRMIHPLDGLSTNTGNHLENPTAIMDDVDVAIVAQGRFRQEGSPSYSYILKPETEPLLKGEYRFQTHAVAYDLTWPDITISRTKDHALKIGVPIPSGFVANFATSIGVTPEFANTLLEEQSLLNEIPFFDEVLTQ